MKEYDPQLKQAMEDLKDVLERYPDVSGTLMLFSRSHGEFALVFPDSMGVSISESKVHLKIKKEERAKAEFATHVIVGNLHLLEQLTKTFQQMFDGIKAKALVAIGRATIVPHDPSMVSPREG